MNTTKYRQWEKKYQITMTYQTIENDVEAQFEYCYEREKWAVNEVTDYLLEDVYCCGAHLCMWFTAIAKKRNRARSS